MKIMVNQVTKAPELFMLDMSSPVVDEINQSLQEFFVDNPAGDAKVLRERAFNTYTKIKAIIGPCFTPEMALRPDVHPSSVVYISCLGNICCCLENIGYAIGMGPTKGDFEEVIVLWKYVIKYHSIALSHFKEMQINIAIDSFKTRMKEEGKDGERECWKIISGVLAGEVSVIDSFIKQGTNLGNWVFSHCEFIEFGLNFPVRRSAKSLNTLLGTAGYSGHPKMVQLLLDNGADPNYCAHFPNFRRFEAGDLTNSHAKESDFLSDERYSILPPWLSTARSMIIGPNQRKEILDLMLKRGANPLLLDAEGKFWFRRIVRETTFPVQLTHVLFSDVRNWNLNGRADVVGRRISVIEDILEEFDQTASAIDLTRSSALVPVPGKDESDLKNSLFHITQWQESLMSNVTALIDNGIDCSEGLAQRVEDRLVLQIGNVQIDSRTSKNASRPLTFLRERNQSIREIIMAATTFNEPTVLTAVPETAKTASAGTSAGLPAVAEKEGVKELPVQKGSPLQTVMDYLG